MEAAPLASVSTFSGLPDDFLDVVNEGKALPVLVHDVEHHIKMTGPEVSEGRGQAGGSQEQV